MKILITGHTQLFSHADQWHKEYIGDTFNAIESGGFFVIVDENGREVHKSVLQYDCHIIRPTWEVMKEAKETGREVEIWYAHGKKWMAKTEEWFAEKIYRLKPEPPKPEYIPYTFKDKEKIKGVWLVDKEDGEEHLVTHVSEIGTNVGGWKYLLEHFAHQNGNPCGKINTK